MKTKRLQSLKVLLCAILAVAVAVSVMLIKPFKARAAVRETIVLDDDFSGELDNNWVVNGTGDDITASVNAEDGVLKIESGAQSNTSYVYLDGTNVTVPQDGSLIVEYDLLGLYNVNASGDAAVSNWTNFYGLLKGIVKVDDEIPAEITPLQLSDTVVHTNPGFSKHAMATPLGRSKKIPVHEARPGFFGEDENAIVRVQSMDTLVYYSDDPACLFRNADGNPVYASGDKGNVVSTPCAGNTFTYTFNKDGSASLAQRAIGADASASAVKYTFPAGTFTQLDGMIGFWLEREGANKTQIIVDNLSVKTSVGGAETTVYESDFSDGAGENWKASAASTEIANPPSILNFDNSAETHYLVSQPYTSIEADSLAGEYYAKYETALKIDSLENRSVAFLFGLDIDDDNAVTAGAYSLRISKTMGGGTYSLSMFVGNGTTTEIIGEEKALESDFADFTDISVKAKCDNTVQVTAGEQTVTFGSQESPIVLDKRFGLAALGEGGTAKFGFKNFKVTSVQSFASEGKDLYMNFDGKDLQGEPWYNSEDYFIRAVKAGVGSDEGVYLKDGKLVFDNAGDTSAFIPQYRYTDFEMIFDLEDICRTPEKDEASGKIVRPVTDKIFICYNGASKQFLYSANNVLSILNPINKEWSAETEDYKSAVADTMQMTRIDATGLTTVKASSFRHNLLDQKYDGKTFRFRIVASGNKISVYYVLLGMEDYRSNLYENAVYAGENESGFDGYVGISNTSFPDKMSASFKIDNFIIRNTDSMVSFPTENEPAPAETVSLDKVVITLTAGESGKITASGESSVTWSTSDDKVATVDENGNITAIGEGTAVITAAVDGNSATCVVVVTAAQSKKGCGCGSAASVSGSAIILAICGSAVAYLLIKRRVKQ